MRGHWPLAWVDPMLDELDASLVASRSVGALVLGGLSTPPAAPLGAQARLVDVRSPPPMVHLNFADAKASGVEAEAPSSHVNNTGQLDIDAGDAALAVSEAALAMDLCPSGPDVCGSGETSSAMVLAGRSPPAMPTIAAAALSFEESLEERLCLHLQMPLIQGPRLRRCGAMSALPPSRARQTSPNRLSVFL
jgi:hypothetical protein